MPNPRPPSSVPSSESFSSAAEILGCGVAAIKAVARVESGRQGAFVRVGTEFWAPTVLFEAHVFDRLTGGKFRGEKAPSLSGPMAILSREKWAPYGYGPFVVQHTRLTYAAQLDRASALKSASWGLFQILGENYKRCGFDELQDFINAMYRSADDHLLAFARFVQSDSALCKALATHDWATFARLYNGPGYARNSYDEKLSSAYAEEKEKEKEGLV